MRLSRYYLGLMGVIEAQWGSVEILGLGGDIEAQWDSIRVIGA